MKRPAFQFYPADWRKDAAVQSCSIAARGLWHEMLCIMHECEPYGHLTVNGAPMTTAQLGRLVGISPRETSKLLAELLQCSVFSKTQEGAIYSRRMVRDEAVRTARAAGGESGGKYGHIGAQHGKKGGRPKKEDGGLETPLADDDKGGSKTPLAGPEKPPPSSSSSSSSSSPPPSSLDTARPDADRVVADFLRLRDRHWPDEPAFPAPTMTLRREAEQLLEKGGTADLIAEVLDRSMTKAKADGGSAPGSLKAYKFSLANAVAAFKTQMPEGRAAAADPEHPKSRNMVAGSPEWHQWRRDNGLELPEHEAAE